MRETVANTGYFPWWASTGEERISVREDLAAYPRDEAADLANCEAWGAVAVVTPSVHEMWPTTPATTATTVSVAGVTELFEGAGRPGHFDGVASVVTKLFAITGPARAYFGEKDFQQLAMVRRL
ncbi:MAG: hypothetical protein EBW31_05700, partial [Actinobacteria bacterium]|nr:hypothetical protein [Actinomycetota bacterium]